MRAVPLAVLLTVLLGLAGVDARAAAQEDVARVVGVEDGDTVTVRAPGRPQFRVRLVEIDAPESGGASRSSGTGAASAEI